MNLQEMAAAIKAHPRIREAGMILYHNGIVRETSRDGRKVKGITVAMDDQTLARLIAAIRSRPGIIDVLVWVNRGSLQVGDDIMLVAIAGDIRDNVFPALRDLVRDIKHEITEKEDILS